MNHLNNIQKIYSKIPDKESKMIYINRMNYSLTGDEGFLESMVDRTVRSNTQWKVFCKFLIEKASDNGMVIFGAGIWGNILYHETSFFLHWKYIVDSNPQNKKIDNLSIVSFENFIEKYNGEYIVISSHKNFYEMEKQLQNFNIPDERIIDAGHMIYQLTEKAIYFDLKELLPCNEREIFVDAGCFDGSTTKQFFEWCSGKGYSYCLEPDVRNITSIKKKLGNNDKIEIIEKALWSKTTTLSMDARGDFATSVTLPNENDHLPRVEAAALDDLLGDQEVTFIKMDIEGAEAEALRGAQKIITEQKPKLAISVYHNPEDILTIPQLILEYNPDYKFYLRHYSFSNYDTVLYAI